MSPYDRRRFLSDLGKAGALLASASWLDAIGYAQITGAGLQADFARNDQVPFVDLVATHDTQNRQASVLMLNRDLDGEREVVLEEGELTPTRVLACETLTGPDLKAFNTFEQPRNVAPQRLEPPAPAARMTFKMPPRSYRSRSSPSQPDWRIRQ